MRGRVRRFVALRDWQRARHQFLFTSLVRDSAGRNQHAKRRKSNFLEGPVFVCRDLFTAFRRLKSGSYGGGTVDLSWNYV